MSGGERQDRWGDAIRVDAEFHMPVGLAVGAGYLFPPCAASIRGTAGGPWGWSAIPGGLVPGFGGVVKGPRSQMSVVRAV
jgi:hypothetical protein